ncbi:MAG TPA: hypothetical protein DCZ43_01100 [candidate division Zixibacteria bacterium]|nr:hypothetical protein [candidate division Zixibacteria bacterium]
MTKKIFLIAAILIIVLYALLLIPGKDAVIKINFSRKPFVWNQDDRWLELERNFKLAKDEGCQSLSSQYLTELGQGNSLLDSLSLISFNPDASLYRRLEYNTFSLAIITAACPNYLANLQEFTIKLRKEVKRQSVNWDMTSDSAQVITYRLLYGARAALEEVMLQVAIDSLPPLLNCNDEPSSTPFTRILGVTIHSGDILISRGGAATSALIARGSDYQGNFSHAALVYVDPKTNLASIIESHIERGVTVSSLESYLKDKKLRVMILRLRHDLPLLIPDPLFPHRVAQAALDEARNRHIAYDFAMDSNDNSKKFCSEVVLDPYAKAGVKLWAKTSHISSPGVASWLSGFGVTHFDTQEPSDLEYDPQITVVAEWRDIETLYNDHIDNAVTDAMLEGAEKGDKLNYNIFLLPLARVAKAYSWILNRFGAVGPVPEGMSAKGAMRNKYYTKEHDRIKTRTLELASRFQITNGYRPPYWELLQLAREAKKAL